MAHAGGRPTKLTKALIEKAKAYLDETSNVNAHTLLPTVEGLALEVKVWRDTLYDWAAKGEGDNATELQKEFSNIFRTLLQAQANKLIQNGLAGRYNSTITSLMMSKHGYVRQTDVTSAGEKMETVVIYRPEKLPDTYADDRAQA